MLVLTEIEAAALRLIIEDNPDYGLELEAQIRFVEVTGRENTGGGFFTSLRVPENIPPVIGPRTLSPNCDATVEGIPSGLGFVLFLSDGRLHMLETYSYDDDTSKFSLESARFSFDRF